MSFNAQFLTPIRAICNSCYNARQEHLSYGKT